MFKLIINLILIFNLTFCSSQKLNSQEINLENPNSELLDSDSDQTHKSADIFKINYLNPVKLNIIDNRVKSVKADIKKLDEKLGKLQKNYEASVAIQNLMYNRLVDYDAKLNQILLNTKPAKLVNQNLNYQYNQNDHGKLSQRVLVGRSISNEDYNHDLIGEFIQNTYNWQNKTESKLIKILNVVAEIYKEDKQLNLDISRLNERQVNEDDKNLFDKMKKEYKEQFSINKAELKNYISNVNENCLSAKVQNDNLTFLLLTIKDDLSTNSSKSATKYTNQDNSLLSSDDETNLSSFTNLKTSQNSNCRNTNNLINSTIEQLRFDLNDLKQQILNRIDRENTRINNNLYTLNNNYQHLNNLRNCSSILKSNDQSNQNNLIDLNSIDTPINQFKSTNNDAAFVPPPFYLPASRKRDDNTIINRSKTNTRTKLINPIKYNQFKNRNCRTTNIMSPSSCEELYLERVNCDGVYVIILKEEAVRVYCEMDTDSGSTVIMRRGQFNDYPLTKFNQNWENYKKGFGTVDADFWIGLDKIYELTKNKNQQLQIDLETYDGEQLSIKYNLFYISDELNNYRLTIGEPIEKESSNYANLFTLHNGSYFVTKDKYDLYNCAKKFEAGWWFLNSPQCHNVLLNGAYYSNSTTPMTKDGIQWPNWSKKQYLKAVQMKITDKKNYQ